MSFVLENESDPITNLQIHICQATACKIKNAQQLSLNILGSKNDFLKGLERGNQDASSAAIPVLISLFV